MPRHSDRDNPAAALPQPANPLEFYETPPAFSRWLFEVVPITGNILSPCAGNNAIQRAVTPQIRPSTHWTWTSNDLDPRWAGLHAYQEDATTLAFWNHFHTAGGEGSRGHARPIDYVVDNPAFSIWEQVAEHALASARQGVALHLRASVHEVLKTGTRRTWMAQHPPSAILWLPRYAFQRSKKTGKWSTDSVCTCWCVWLREQTRSLFPEQRIYYAPERTLVELQAETKAFRAEMDLLMAGFAR